MAPRLDPANIEAAARTIAAARLDVAKLPDSLHALMPGDLADGYAVQRAFRALWPGPIGGWKVGATAETVQAMYGVGEPFFGPIYQADILPSPAEPRADKFQHYCLESEFVFRLGRDLPARERGYRRDDIMRAVDAVIPAIELISPRFETILTHSAPLVVADCAINGGLVLGEPVPAWRGLDLAALPVRLLVDDEPVEEGNGARALGDPLNVLIWLVDAMGRQGLGLEAGQVVSTGTCTGVHFVLPGQRALADFGALGQVEVVFL